MIELIDINPRKIKRTLIMLSAIFLYAITFNLLLRPNGIIIGGMGGIALLINKTTNYDIAILILIISVLLTLLGYIYLERRILIRTLIAAVSYPLFIKITYNISEYIVIDHNEMLIIAIFAGILLGTSDGLVEKTNLYSGGTDIISKLLVKYTKITNTTSIVVVEGLILVFGLFVYGVDSFVYALVVLYVLSMVSSKIMLNISQRKIFYIYTDDVEDIKRYIHHNLGYDVTAVKNEVKGRHQNILISVVYTKDYYSLKEGIELIDPHAKIVIFDSYEHYERKEKDLERKKIIQEAYDGTI